MATKHLGLFDTAPNQLEVRLGLAIVGSLVAAVFLIFPLRDTQLGEISVFVPLLDAVMLFSDLIIATLLYAQASVFRSRSLTILASAYLFTGLLLFPHALTFPGAFTPNGLLGAGTNTTAWIAIFRRFAFPVGVILYGVIKAADSAAQDDGERPNPPILAAALTAATLSGLGTLLATSGHDLLPAIFRNARDTVPTSLIAVNFGTIALTITAMVLLLRQKRSVLDLWLLVGLSAWALQSLLNITLQTRYTVGWYGLNAMTFISSLVLMLALIAESNRLYARLALHAAALEREREARLMSMDAVTASLAHEIGQPVASAKLSAAAGLDWLTRETPDPKMAVKCLRAVMDAGDRIFDVVTSVRTTFSRGPHPRGEFSPNDLVRETATLLERDLAAHKIALKMSLAKEITTIHGNRIQLQRVLVNLLTNAIDSVSLTRGRPRRIEVSSELLPSGHLLVDVTDSGAGISPEDMVRIFEAFVTTKATGVGLGLWLSRIIVEEHGGRLWASADEEYGVTFHLQLPPGLPKTSQ